MTDEHKEDDRREREDIYIDDDEEYNEGENYKNLKEEVK